LDFINQAGLFQNGASPIDLIRDLYPIMEDDLSIFLHSKVYNEKTDPIDFLQWMLNCYEEIHHEANWTIDAEYGTGIFHTWRMYDYDIGECGESIPIDFMPKLKKENLKIYKLMAGMISVMVDRFGIPAYWNDDENDIKRIKFNKKIFDALIPKNKLEQACVDFIKTSLGVIEQYPNEHFHKYLHMREDEGEDGTPITPVETCGILWDYDDDNRVASVVKMGVQSRWENYGSIPLRYQVKDDGDDRPSLFPYELINLLKLLGEVSQFF